MQNYYRSKEEKKFKQKENTDMIHETEIAEWRMAIIWISNDQENIAIWWNATDGDFDRFVFNGDLEEDLQNFWKSEENSL